MLLALVLRESVYSGSVGEYLHKAVLYLTPEMFGALGDGISDDRKAIQDAIDKANEIFLTSGKMVDLYIAGFHLVKLNPNSLGIGGEVAAGRGYYVSNRVFVYADLGQLSSIHHFQVVHQEQ